MSMEGFKTTLDSVVEQGPPVKPKKKQEVKLRTRAEVESELEAAQAEVRLVKEATTATTSVEEMQESYERENVEGRTLHDQALAKVKDSDKSGLDLVQQQKRNLQTPKVIADTEKYIARTHREIRQVRVQKGRLSKELQDIARVELAEEVAELADGFFKDAANLDGSYKTFFAKAAELRATGQGWDKIIDRMVTPFIKVCIDSTIPNSPTLIDFLVSVQSVSGPYLADNPMAREYSEMQHPPHKYLRAVRDHYGVNPEGQLTDGGIKV